MADLLTEVYGRFHERYCYTSIADYALAGSCWGAEVEL